MNKTEFVKHIKSKLDCDTKEATKLVDSFTKCLISALVKQDEVLLQGFGRFYKTFSKERPGRNPATGQEVTIAAYNQIKFKPGKIFKEAVNK